MNLQLWAYLSKPLLLLPKAVSLGIGSTFGIPYPLLDKDRTTGIYCLGVSGSGKSRFMTSILLQDISHGHPFCLIDPTGSIYRPLSEYIALVCKLLMSYKQFSEAQIKKLLHRYIFIDLADSACPVRFNPLEITAGENPETVANDFVKSIERLFGSIDETRRLRNILLNGAIILAALGLRIQDLFEFLVNADYRSYLLQQTPKNQYTQFAIKYWQEYFSNFRSDREKQERIESTINVLQYFEDSMVRNFTCCYHSTIDFKQAMEKGITILCYIPMGQNLKGSQVIGSLMATKFQRLAYRRTPEERKKQYYLIIDEMHHFVDFECNPAPVWTFAVSRSPVHGSAAVEYGRRPRHLKYHHRKQQNQSVFPIEPA